MANDTRTKITFLGTSSAVPDIGGDSPTFLINDRYLVDTGWNVANNLRDNGIDPLQLQYVFFTHFHHDHYLSLPALLFYWLMKGKPLNELRIAGPAEDLQRMIRLAMDFLQADRYYADDNFPVLIPLAPGDSYEEQSFRLDTCSTVHPVPGLCFRFTDKATGIVFSFTGDTAFHPPIVEHVKGSALLVHESALGPIAADPAHNAYMHSGAVDAARIATAAGVGKLLLIHASAGISDACVEAAAKIFPREVLWPFDGQTFEL